MDIKRLKNKLVICGTGRTISLLRDIENCEVWGVNNLFNLNLTGFDRWFEIHVFEEIKKLGRTKYLRRGIDKFGNQSVKDYLSSLASLNIPVFMHKKMKMIPLSEEFPFEEIMKNYKYQYFTNSISWELGLAILMGYKEISLFGVEMEEYFERRYQKGSVEYFLGYAQGKGIKVNISLDSPLLKAPFLYGFEGQNLYV